MLDRYNDIITVEDLCEILMIGKNTAYALLSHGEIKSFRNGTRWKMPKIAVIEYVKKRAGF